MKYIGIIPDVHGRDYWKEYVLREDIKEFIFLGDYTDSFDVSNDDMINNLLDIIQFKKDFPDKVTLLYGNHDLQYLYLQDNKYRCSGFRPDIAFDLCEIFMNNKSLFQNAYQIGNTLFTHAGVHSGWFRMRFNGDITESKLSIAEQLNNPKDRNQEEALHDVGYRRGGYKGMGGIFWCDKVELNKPLLGFDQVVGHTHVDEIKHQIWKGNNVWFVDCHGSKKDYLTLLL